MGRQSFPEKLDKRAVERQNRGLTILNAIAQALNRAVDLDWSRQTILSKVAEILDLETGWISLFR